MDAPSGNKNLYKGKFSTQSPFFILRHPNGYVMLVKCD